MKGKERCKALKEIRRQIAEKNDIAYAVSECTYQGECKGTCPKCEAELRYLERELELRKSLGKAVAVAGISASVCTGLTGCGPAEAVEDFLWEVGKKVGIVEETSGVLPAPEIAGDIQIAPTPTPSADGLKTETLEGDVPFMEPTEEPDPNLIEGGMEFEASVEALVPTEEMIAGELPELITPLPEMLEGDIAMVETSDAMEIAGMIMPFPSDIEQGETAEIITEDTLSKEGQE